MMAVDVANNLLWVSSFVPRGKQFGYIFLSGISKNEAGHVIAHELGHGLWKLKHTFDESYGKTAAATEGTTDNLMDYNKGAHLAKWQWDVMREPAIFDGVLDSDEEGMMVKPFDDDKSRMIEFMRLLRLSQTHNVPIINPCYTYNGETKPVNNIVVGSNLYFYIKAKKLATKKTIQINENILYIDEWEITTGSDDEAKSLQDFVLGKEVEIYGKSNESITINGEKIDFESIIKTSENMLAQCVSLGIYNNLTRAERQIIDLPVVEWKLGYYYGAAFIRHWFLGSGSPIKLDDENIDELLEKSVIFQEHLEKGIKLIETNIYNSDNPISICDSIAKFVIENRKKEEQMWIDIDLSPEYEPNINRNNRLSTYSITESDLVNLSSLGLKDEDFATAIGSVIIGFYFTGNIEIKGIDRGDVMADIYYRFTDGFNFIDDGIINAIISQPLGSWEVNPFGANLKTPSPGFSIQNKDFNSLYRKMNRTNPSLKNMAPNFSVITKYRKIKGVWTVNFVSDLLNCKCYVKREN